MGATPSAPAEESAQQNQTAIPRPGILRGYGLWIVLLFASIVFITGVISPPHLMDDVDGVQAQIARNMIQSGDWVTAHVDGVKYFEKSPLKYWMIALCYEFLGVRDWVARIPIAISAILLCWLTARMAVWAIGVRTGLYAGLALATSVGLWLFTRILIADVILTLSIAFAIWSFVRAIDPEDTVNARRWALTCWASIGVGLLLKGLIAIVFPVGTALIYLLASGLWSEGGTWRRLHIVPGLLVMLAVAAPWHVLATIRNPPYFAFTLHSESGNYHGFFWFYFFNEHILRFLGLRYPRDYDTVPRALFWLLHLAWFFPWSPFFVRAFRLRYRGIDRASRMRLLCLCWIGVVMVFFTLSTTQEYYSMPAYPAFAILIGSAMAESDETGRGRVMRTAGALAGIAFVAIAGILWASRGYPAPGDIAEALTSHPESYTLSLGHMGDLTTRSMAYLRLPLVIAGLAMLIGSVGSWRFRDLRAVLALAAMMVLFFQAARLALIAFDPYLGSWPLAQALKSAPEGGIMIDDPYWEMSTIGFYTNRTVMILNGRRNNLEYGSYSPGAPPVFIDNAGFTARWSSPDRWYIVSEDQNRQRLHDLAGSAVLRPIATAGGKTVYTNR
jgi:4-amino-4-deoxy-L-arabinose transferase-like glycosyltransferase